MIDLSNCRKIKTVKRKDAILVFIGDILGLYITTKGIFQEGEVTDLSKGRCRIEINSQDLTVFYGNGSYSRIPLSGVEQIFISRRFKLSGFVNFIHYYNES